MDDGTIENIITQFMQSFDQADYEKIEKLLDKNVESFITNAGGVVNELKGREAFMDNIRALDLKSVKPKVAIKQLLKINAHQGLVMVEVKAKRKGRKLHNHAAYLIDVFQERITKIRMVEALPAYSDTFWKS